MSSSIASPVDAPQAYSPAVAAQLLGCSRDLVDRMLRDGTLDSRRYGGRIFIAADSISRFLKGGQ